MVETRIGEGSVNEDAALKMLQDIQALNEAMAKASTLSEPLQTDRFGAFTPDMYNDRVADILPEGVTLNAIIVDLEEPARDLAILADLNGIDAAEISSKLSTNRGAAASMEPSPLSSTIDLAADNNNLYKLASGTLTPEELQAQGLTFTELKQVMTAPDNPIIGAIQDYPGPEYYKGIESYVGVMSLAENRTNLKMASGEISGGCDVSEVGAPTVAGCAPKASSVGLGG